MSGLMLGFLFGLLIELCLFTIFLSRELKTLDMLKQINNIIGDKLIEKCMWLETQVENGMISDKQASFEFAKIKTLSVIWDEIMNITCEKIAFSFKKITPENFLNERQMNLINKKI